MARVINFDKGSKKRLREIRWKHREIVSAALLILALAVLAIWFAFFQNSGERFLDPLPAPQLKQLKD
jgi:hypothetical protein